jgi:hypothetical protein
MLLSSNAMGVAKEKESWYGFHKFPDPSWHITYIVQALLSLVEVGQGGVFLLA